MSDVAVVPLVSRISPVGEPASAGIEAAFAAVVPPPYKVPLLYKVLARNEGVFRAFSDGALLSRRGLMHTGQLPWPEREFVILRVTGRLGAAHEWGVHVAYFGGAGAMTSEQLEDTVRATLTAGLWDERRRAIAALVDALVGMHDIDDAAWTAASRALSEEERIEVVMLAGIYTMIAWAVRAFRVPEEKSAPEFPWGAWTPIAPASAR